MDTEEKIARLKSLQAELGKPSSGKKVVSPKAKKAEFKKIGAGIILIQAFLQYLFMGYHTITGGNIFLFILTLAILPACIYCADSLDPIQKLNEGEPGLANTFNCIVVGSFLFTFYCLTLIALLFAMEDVLDWSYSLMLLYPIILIEWVKRRKKV